MSEPIYVTRPFLPPLSEFLPMLQQIWDSRVLTNYGPYHARLEERLRAFLEVDNVSLVANGMMALSVAIEAAGLEGEVITTPYSFVATAHAVRLERLTPVFVDVRPSDLTLDPVAVEAAITPRTSAILGVHVYGNPCAVDELRAVADRHGLKLIYDAAHAFGVRYRGASLLHHGDFSTLSFHATKAFNTFEGGAVVIGDPNATTAVDRARNFGIANEVEIPSVGMNAKMSEFNAALGLLQLEYFERVRNERARVDRLYRERLVGVEGIECLAVPQDVEPNHSYFPILVTPGFRLRRDELYETLKVRNIFTRRYFYPLLSNLPVYRDLPSAAPERLPLANRAAREILCLPIYPEIGKDEQDRVVDAIAWAARGG